jgi:bifunctional non-homologous end joining protein LigD
LSFRHGVDRDNQQEHPGTTRILTRGTDDTVIDGEVVALDAEGRLSFHELQNHGVGPVPVVYYVFDVLVLGGRDVMTEPLTARRELLRASVLQALAEPVRSGNRRSWTPA